MKERKKKEKNAKGGKLIFCD